MTVQFMKPAPDCTISSLASALTRLEAIADTGMPRDLDLQDWLDSEAELLSALAATHPANRDELLLKASVAIRRLLQMVDQDPSDEVELAKSVLLDLQSAAQQPRLAA
jgi:hypothetical protein